MGAIKFIAEKVLGIDFNERYAHQPDDLDKRAYQVLHPADIYLEREPTVGEWIKEFTPTREGVAEYVVSLFPSATWITRYRGAWLLGDVIAGITIGLVVVPQAMAYALLAQLTPAYGLYTSFTGAVLYWIFGTSKDIVIGTTAVGSLLVGQVVSAVDKQYPGEFRHEEIAHSLSLLSGAALLFIGLLRLGWIIEFIPYIPVSAFVTAASITIMSTQIPTVLGISGINTHEPPYKVIINVAKALPRAKLDAVIGLTCIVMLFIIRDFCSFMEKRRPSQKRIWSFVSSLRLTFAMLLYTLISFLVNRNLDAEDAKFRIVGHIDPGFQKANLPQPAGKLLSAVLPQLPAVALILVIEHVAIAKAMGRQFNYNINPSQEIVALGSANLFSPFVGGYVCTGSFGASAVLSKAGVRTPLAGLFSAIVLVLALYVLTAVFYYIPNAALAGLIIHAVCNLVTPPKNLHKYWLLSPLELLIWITGVVLAIFKSLETSIYIGIALSLVLMLVRIARTKGQFMGRVKARRVEQEGCTPGDDGRTLGARERQHHGKTTSHAERDLYLPLNRRDASNPLVKIEMPYPGVFIYRFNESFNYLNQSRHIMLLLQHIQEHTKRRTTEHYEKESDRPWNEAEPKNDSSNDQLPYLRALVLDFSTLNNIDITSVQGLIDLRNTLDRHCAPDAVELHFANIHNRWTRRALAAAGFGYPSAKNNLAQAYWRSAYTIATVLDEDDQTVSRCRTTPHDEEATCKEAPVHVDQTGASHGFTDSDSECQTGEKKEASISGVDRPFFHVDLQAAVDAAVRGAESRDRPITNCMLAEPELCATSA